MPFRYPACRKAVITSTSNAIELPAVPAKMYTPNMVEYQRKLRLIIQSTAPNVRQRANSGRLMNDNRRIQIVNRDFRLCPGARKIAAATETQRSRNQRR